MRHLVAHPHVADAGDLAPPDTVSVRALVALRDELAWWSGMLDVIADNENGLYCTPEDPQSFIATISEYVARSPEARAAFGERARAFVLDNFGWDRVAERYVAYLQAVIDRSRR